MRLFYRINNSANEVQKYSPNKHNVLASIDNNFERKSEEINQELNQSKNRLIESENEDQVKSFISKENNKDNFLTSKILDKLKYLSIKSD